VAGQRYVPICSHRGLAEEQNVDPPIGRSAGRAARRSRATCSTIPRRYGQACDRLAAARVSSDGGARPARPRLRPTTSTRCPGGGATERPPTALPSMSAQGTGWPDPPVRRSRRRSRAMSVMSATCPTCPAWLPPCLQGRLVAVATGRNYFSAQGLESWPLRDPTSLTSRTAHARTVVARAACILAGLERALLILRQRVTILHCSFISFS